MMAKEEVLNIIKPSLNEVFCMDINFELSTKFTDLNLDSIRFITLIVKCEEIFGFEIDDDNLIISKYTTINDFIEMLLSYINEEDLK